MIFRPLILLLVLFLPLSAAAQIIKVGGSTTVKAFMDPAVEAYRKHHPDVQIDVQGGGSGLGVAGAIDRSVHIGMLSRELSESEKADLSGVKQISVGIDAVAVVLSDQLYHGLHMHSLSKDSIAAIYRGEIDNWAAVGGPDRHILLIDKEMHRGTRQVFAKFILGQRKSPVLPQAVVVGPNRHMRTLLEASDQAIGFLPFGELDEHVQGIEIIVDGKAYAPTVNEVRSGNYPLGRTLYLLVPDDAPEYVRDFLEFLASAEGIQILKQTGYLPVK